MAAPKVASEPFGRQDHPTGQRRVGEDRSAAGGWRAEARVGRMETERWQRRLAEAARRHRVPGAVLAVLDGDRVHEWATGVLNVDTGVPVTTDSVFQIGSITKLFTGTLVMQQVEDGTLELDAPLRTVLPEFRLADMGAADRITMRHLLNHTSGIPGDVFTDTGRGDDCLERYVERCAELTPCHPVGATMSYSNSGFSVAGRVLEKVTGKVWDTLLTERLTGPLGLTHTVTLAEEAILFRAAVGHEGDDRPRPVTQWALPRSIGPAGTICSTAAELLAFARMHLDGGLTADGTRALAPESAAAMRDARVEIPDGWSGRRYGLAWCRWPWDGREVIGHDGETLGQNAFLRIVPDRRVAVALLLNGGDPNACYAELYTDLMAELADLTVPLLTVPAPPADVDITPLVGTYRTPMDTVRVELRDGRPWAVATEDMVAGGTDVREFALTPRSATVLVGRRPGRGQPSALAFHELPDGTRYLHTGGRVMLRDR